VPTSPHDPAATPADADVARYYAFVEAVLLGGDPGAAARFVADDFVEHDAGEDRGRAAYLARLAARRDAFPDAAWTIEFLGAAGGLVLCETSMTAARAGRRVRARETVAARFVGGRMAECWRTGHPLEPDAVPGLVHG
jgi:predicted ester cyclase